jgi:DNA-binding MarR family transcriptional regulator
MKPFPTKDVTRVWARLVKAQQIVLASIEQRLKAAKLPPLAWYDTLLELERAEGRGLRPFELEREMLLAQYNLSRLVDRLEEEGYVERRPFEGDGRGQLIAITVSGKSMRRRMWAVYGPEIQCAFGDHLTPRQAKSLGALLGLLIEKSPGRRRLKT